MAGANDFWSRRTETIGSHKVLHLVQAPEKNAFDRQRPDLGGGAVVGEVGSSLRDMRGQLERECAQFRLNGR